LGGPNSGAWTPSLAVDAAALVDGQNRAPHLVWDVVVRGTQCWAGVFYCPTSVMTAADTHFRDTFPFSSDCRAYTDLPPVTDPPVRCNLFFLGTTTPVSVVDRTATSFTFKSARARRRRGPLHPL
jgi:hypothetical protein